MKALHVLVRILGVFMAMALLAAAGAMTWAAINDFQSRETVPNGVVVAERSLAGMNAAQARSTIATAVSTPLLAEVSVDASGQALTFDPEPAVSIDVDKMLAQAYSSRSSAPFLGRLQHDLLGSSLSVNVTTEFSIDESAVKSWVADVASKVDTQPVDATREIVGYELVAQPSSPGVTVDQTATTAAIVKALTSETKKVPLSVKLTPAAVTELSFGKTIVVSLSERRVRLYDGATLIRTYPCAVGMSGYSTPVGDWKVVDRQYMPTWGNPGSDWAKDMPATIPPGPGNPLGTRALALSAPYILFHGTSDTGSIGTAASHGCMRMYQQDIEEMYELVPVGTPVYIRK
ncbi:MAG: L,D-transpeptidase family protein [Coriobacteriia bacterium]|nr:L,D-transpeptidase family protein [Coriobacteriia bacterium]